MPNYTAMQAKAGAAIRKNGMGMTLRRQGKAAFDPATGKAGTATTDYPCAGLVSSYAAQLVNGTTIQVGDKKVLLDATKLHAQGIQPAPGDKLLIGTALHSVVKSDPLAPAGIPIYFELQVRL